MIFLSEIVEELVANPVGCPGLRVRHDIRKSTRSIAERPKLIRGGNSDDLLTRIKLESTLFYLISEIVSRNDSSTHSESSQIPCCACVMDCKTSKKWVVVQVKRDVRLCRVA